MPSIPQKGHLSGADIEGMVGRAWRISLLAGQDRITKEALEEVVAQFMPSTQGLERELQETAAMLECTDRQFLPDAIVAKMEAEGGRGKLQARLTAIKQLVEADVTQAVGFGLRLRPLVELTGISLQRQTATADGPEPEAEAQSLV